MRASPNMSALAKTVWLIESRLSEDIPLDEVARHTGLSRSHASRMFAYLSGRTISSYVRGRRLSEAAKTLAAGAPDILSVALDAGYGSHEAFTRAFRDLFGVTPEEVRRRRSTENLALVEPLPMTESKTETIDDPRIEILDAFRIAGLAERQNMSDAAGIPGQWQRFSRFIDNIDGQVGGAAFGFVGEMSGDDAFEYVAGVEVTPDAELPPELTAFDIPAQRWAKFTHKGHITGIRATIGAIYSDWLPRSGETQNETASFLEYYGPDFDPRAGTGTVEIWIGLKD